MSSSPGLSLRGRLLVLLIAVTTLFLLVLGVVTTLEFTAKLHQEFRATIRAESTRTPASITQYPAPGIAAVEFYGTHSVEALSTERSVAAITRALRLAITKMSMTEVFKLGSEHSLFQVPQSGPVDYGLVAAAYRIPATQNVDRIPGVLIVAERDSGVTNQVHELIFAEMITGGCLIALLAVGGQWLIGRGLEPIARMARTANDITARGDLTERMPRTDDQSEVGRLGAAINTMLDQIQQEFGARLSSEQKVREFAADASHELRTPLTTIRGYAELYRQGALGPDQLPGAMRRIEQEAQRMSTLVAELLELARLDRTSSLDLTETDLATVVRDAVADAMAVEPDRPISAQAPPRLIAVVDERRIRQVLANLLGNVRAHTPRSASVAVRLGPVQGGVLIEVADTGPGMAPEDEAKAFDRFHRAAEHGMGGLNAADDPSAQDGSAGGGSGLGLSIVQAIANAHGGQATLESWLGHGTRVRIWLPTRPGSALGEPDAGAPALRTRPLPEIDQRISVGSAASQSAEPS
jgi:two-component system, OmpR family, sensor kinase